jgi:hypothetical protein
MNIKLPAPALSLNKAQASKLIQSYVKMTPTKFLKCSSMPLCRAKEASTYEQNNPNNKTNGQAAGESRPEKSFKPSPTT